MVNKRKRKTPARYVNPNRRYPSWKALNTMSQHFNTSRKPELINELRDLVGEANELYHESPLQWPFNLQNYHLRAGISRAKKENFFNRIDQMRGTPGWWNPLTNQNQQYWLDYNDAVQNTYKKHLNLRDTFVGYERLNNILR
jgi:hypothetical protein